MKKSENFMIFLRKSKINMTTFKLCACFYANAYTHLKLSSELFLILCTAVMRNSEAPLVTMKFTKFFSTLYLKN